MTQTLPVAGAEIPRLGLGTWQLRGDDAAEAVRHALEIGYRHIDTARAYENEREVGRGLRDAGLPRDEVFVTTKVWQDDLAPDDVRRSAEASLRDLGLDFVDLILIHWPSKTIPLAETLDAFTRLKDDGLTRLIGVSNFPPGLFERALELAPIATNQVEFHPFLGQDRLLDIAERRDSSVTAYAPLAHGKAVRDEVLRAIAAEKGVTPGQLALRWLLDFPRAIVVPKASSPERRAENLAAQEVELSRQERERIDALPKDRRDFSPEFGPDDWDA